MTGTCPPEKVLADLLADRLTSETEAGLEDHLSACHRCRERLDLLTGWEREEAELSTGDDDTALPLRLVTTVAARLARAIPVETLARPRARTGKLPTVPGYEVMAEIGRGGCGIVYRAIDRSLARTVALKLLRDRAGPEAHERFQREAAALAKLRHPNIVQIFGVGETDGQPFIALEYIAGGSLATFTAGQPQDPSASAALIESLARGVGAANAAGLVHRDLKPANVLLESRTGCTEPKSLADAEPKVTDFGVVKSLAADPGLTDTRDFLGTPSYMAPEQAGTGRVVDRRADVHALGAILYELLAGRPPFRAPTPIDTLVQVAFDEPVPPSRFQPKLPRDLETVCLKCLEKEPARRYATAEALADDLARFRDGVPVHARPIRWPARAWRWCRRSPRRAAVAGLAASLLLVLAVGGPIVAEREHSLRQQSDAHEATAVEQQERARQHLELASRALDATLEGLVRNARLRAYGMDDVRADALRGAVPYLADFASREEGSPDIQARQGRAAIQLATVGARSGQRAETVEKFQHGIALFELLVAKPDGARFATDLSNAHMEFGRFLLGDSSAQPTAPEARKAERQLREALRIADSIAADGSGTLPQQDQKAIVLALLGQVPAATGPELKERRDLLIRAFHIRDRLATENPDREDLQRYATIAALNLALLLNDLGQKQEAADILSRALDRDSKLTGAAAPSLDGPQMRSDIEGLFGTIRFEMGQRAEGLHHVGEALRTATAAAEIFPAQARFLADALRWHNTLADMLEAGNDNGKSTDVRRAAVALAKRITGAAPSVAAHREGLLAAHLTLAEQLDRNGQEPNADAEFASAATVARQLPSASVGSERAASRAECFRRLAKHNLRTNNSIEALAWLDGAVALIETDPHWSNGAFRCEIERVRATILDRLGRPAEAATARARADGCRHDTPPVRLPQG